MRLSLALLLAVAALGCTDSKSQVVTGRVTTGGAVAVRAVSGDSVITAGRVRTDGSFTLVLPAGHRYRLEVLTATQVHHVVAIRDGVLVDLDFQVCAPKAPFDLGMFGDACDPSDPMCGKCDPGDPTCGAPCDPMSDPDCGCDPSDPTCGKCDPNDPMCVPPPCDPSDPTCVMCDPSDPSCAPPCDPMDPMCQPCDPTDPDCKMCMPGDPNCGTCDPMLDASCPTPPPPCENPMDPNTCKDPCMEDPALCGCDMATEMTCWPPPETCTSDDKMCTPDGNYMPANMPTDFGCKGG